jgi:hypothetical protein
MGTSEAGRKVSLSRERLERRLRRFLTFWFEGSAVSAHDQHDEDDWLQLTAAARVATVGRATLDRYATTGRVPFATIRGERWFHRADVVALRESRRAGGPSITAA